MAHATDRPTPGGSGSSPAGIGARILGLAERQRDLFAELDACQRRQSALIEADAVEELVAFLETRQATIDRLVEVSAELDACRLHWDALVSTMPAEHTRRVRALLDESASLAVRVRAGDEADQERLGRKREALADEMSSLERGRGAIGAYGQRGDAAGPKFQDREA